MQLSATSISAKLYQWFYNDDLPNNLCPYFWKQLIMWVLILPYSILCLPSIVIFLTTKDNYSVFVKPIVSAFLYLLLFGAFSMLSVIPYFFGIKYEIQFAGMMLWIVVIVGIAYHYINNKINDYRYARRHPNRKKVKQSNVVVEFVKAKYNKYCPQITWVNTNSPKTDSTFEVYDNE